MALLLGLVGAAYPTEAPVGEIMDLAPLLVAAWNAVFAVLLRVFGQRVNML